MACVQLIFLQVLKSLQECYKDDSADKDSCDKKVNDDVEKLCKKPNPCGILVNAFKPNLL